jgi:hypothetical protein
MGPDAIAAARPVDAKLRNTQVSSRRSGAVFVPFSLRMPHGGPAVRAGAAAPDATADQ